MNRHEIAAEFEEKFKAGEIGSCSIKELQEYLEAIADFSSTPVAKYSERSSHIQIINTLISVKTLENVNKTIEHTESTIGGILGTVYLIQYASFFECPMVLN